MKQCGRKRLDIWRRWSRRDQLGAMTPLAAVDMDEFESNGPYA
jgi:hypothetical protein